MTARQGRGKRAVGAGPMGGAFFLWDKAMKTGDAREMGLMAFLTPLLFHRFGHPALERLRVVQQELKVAEAY